MSETTQQPEKKEIIDRLYDAIDDDTLDNARDLIAQLHPSEIADALESLPGKSRHILWELVEPGLEGDVLSELQSTVRNELLEDMHPHEVINVTRDLDADDVADIIQELPDEVRDTVFLAMDEQYRQRLASVLSYPDDSAGGLMNIDVISVRTDVTLDVVLRYLRLLKELPEKTDELMVVDRDNRYLGVLPLTALLCRDTSATVSDIMTDKEAIPAMTPAHEVAKLFEQRDLLSAAVINEDNLLVGRITVDDVVDVIQEEAEHTMRSMAGVGQEDIFAPVLQSIKHRAVWLGINLITAFLAASVIGRFEDTIQQIVALAVLMPIVAGMGGVAGSQTLIIVTRGLATGQIGKSNAQDLLYKELGVGLLSGIVWATVVSTIVYIWFDDLSLGLVIGMAMITNLIVAALAGSGIPLVLKKAGIDPAIAGGVILTTITDVTGFLTFLGLATWLLLN